MKVAILLLAAGRGSRLGAAVPKAFLPLGDRTLVEHAAARLLASLAPGDTCEMVLATHPDDRAAHVEPAAERLRRVLGARGSLSIVDGGAERQQSMQRALAATAADVELVAVHDAARPFVPVANVRECWRAAAEIGAALLAVPAPDTLKRVRGGTVDGTLDRTGIWLAQTPQIVRRNLLQRALDAAAASGFVATDDAGLVEALGAPVAVVPGTATNLKITRPEDLPLAAAILAAERPEHAEPVR